MVGYMSAAVALRTVPLGTVEVLAEIGGLLDRMESGDVIGGTAASAALGVVDRVITRLGGPALVGRGGGRSEVAAESGMTGTGAWLAARTRSEGGQAQRDVRLATASTTGWPRPGGPGGR